MNMSRKFYTFVIILILSIIILPIIYFNSIDNITTTIVGTDIDIQSYNEEVSRTYMVFTQDEVFTNEDYIFSLKFNSSDFQNEFKNNIGNTYNLTVIGWRVPFFSMYRNIIKYELINEQDENNTN